MKKLKMIIAVLCLVPMHTGSLYAEMPKDGSASEETTTLEDMAGTFPVKFRHIINQLKASDAALKSGKKLPQLTIENRLMLYGPTGNGKTTIAKKIAEESKAHCMYKPACELLGSRPGEGAANIKKIFSEAMEYADKNKQPVVIVFDGMELFLDQEVSKNDFLDLQLCAQLDEIEGDARVFFIGIINADKI